jgi:hypothetical protein
MKIAAIVKTHGNTQIVMDCIEALRLYVTENIVVVVDGSKWESWGQNVPLGVDKIRGFPQGSTTSMYRNAAACLDLIYDKYPDCDWYCVLDYDVLFASDGFKEELKSAAAKGVWCMGSDLRSYPDVHFPYLESIIGEKIECAKYLIGCCVFHHRNFVSKLKSIGFYKSLLQMTETFKPGYFPDCEQIFDFGAWVFPTLAYHYGGDLDYFACWNDYLNTWTKGDYKKYPIRWKPEIVMDEVANHTSIIHPVKTANSEISTFYRWKRRRVIRENVC